MVIPAHVAPADAWDFYYGHHKKNGRFWRLAVKSWLRPTLGQGHPLPRRMPPWHSSLCQISPWLHPRVRQQDAREQRAAETPGLPHLTWVPPIHTQAQQPPKHGPPAQLMARVRPSLVEEHLLLLTALLAVPPPAEALGAHPGATCPTCPARRISTADASCSEVAEAHCLTIQPPHQRALCSRPSTSEQGPGPTLGALGKIPHWETPCVRQSDQLLQVAKNSPSPNCPASPAAQAAGRRALGVPNQQVDLMLTSSTSSTHRVGVGRMVP